MTEGGELLEAEALIPEVLKHAQGDGAAGEGKGWSLEEMLAYAKTIGDNHPMFAQRAEVSLYDLLVRTERF
jgi:hypothetical protein